MPDVAEEIFDEFTLHDVDIERVSAGARRKILARIRKIERETKAAIAVADSPSQKRRLKAILDNAQAIARREFKGMRVDMQEDMRQLAQIESAYTRLTINNAIGVDLMTKSVPAGVLEAAVDDALILGAPAKEWWDRQYGSWVQKFSDQMRQGIFLGESVPELANRIKLVLPQLEKFATTLARTSVQSVTNAARMATYEENDDLIKGVVASATLDTRTSDICINRDGLAWDLEGKPLEGTTQPWPGPPPWHFNCRSTLRPILKGFDEIAGPNADPEAVKRAKQIPKGTRASMDGQIPDSINYREWLEAKEKLNPGFAEKVLGKTKYKLWKDGKLTLGQMVDQKGFPLTVAQLKAKLEVKEAIRKAPTPSTPTDTPRMKIKTKYFPELRLGPRRAIPMENYSSPQQEDQMAKLIDDSITPIHKKYPQLLRNNEVEFVLKNGRHGSAAAFYVNEPFDAIYLRQPSEQQDMYKRMVERRGKGDTRIDKWISYYNITEPLVPEPLKMTESIHHTIRHEFGHWVQNRFDNVVRKTLGATARGETIMMDALVQSGWATQHGPRQYRLRHDRIKHRLSFYGATNINELYAESFAVYTSPRYIKGQLPEALENFLEHTIQTVARINYDDY